MVFFHVFAITIELNTESRKKKRLTWLIPIVVCLLACLLVINRYIETSLVVARSWQVLVPRGRQSHLEEHGAAKGSRARPWRPQIFRVFQPTLGFLSAIGGTYGNYERGYPQVLNGLVLKGFIWSGFCKSVLCNVPTQNYVEIVPPETALQAANPKQSSLPKKRQHGLKTTAPTHAERDLRLRSHREKQGKTLDKRLADTKARESIAQLVESQPSKQEVGRQIPTGRLALCGTYMDSALAFLEFFTCGT